MSELKPTCCANVPYGNWGRTKQCTFKVKVTEDGKPYCMVHAPSVATKKWEEKTARWQVEKNARQAARDAKTELERRADCFPEMLEALKELADAGGEAWGEDRPCVRDARAAISKAEGELK